jgi:hypothetical protein
VNDTAGPEPSAEFRELVLRRVVGMLRFLLGIQVVQVPEELVETVRGGKEVVAITEVVLSKLPGGVTLVLQRGCDRGPL